MAKESNLEYPLKTHSVMTSRQSYMVSTLIISYNSKLLQQICFNKKVAISNLGLTAAVNLKARHEDILAANNIYELPVGEISESGNVCQLKVNCILNIKMIPNYPANDHGRIYDWRTVNRVKFIRINHAE